MKQFISIVFLLLVSVRAHATTTVTVNDDQSASKTVVVQQTPVLVTSQQPVVIAQPVVVAVVDTSADFEGEIERIDRNARTFDIIDTEGRTRQVFVGQESLDTYRAGDYVRIHPVVGVREVTFIREESNRDLEGRIINVDSSQSLIVVRDGEGRDRRVELKQGMISNYKVDDYVRIHLMADLKEAKMIRTIKK